MKLLMLSEEQFRDIRELLGRQIRASEATIEAMTRSLSPVKAQDAESKIQEFMRFAVDAAVRYRKLDEHIAQAENVPENPEWSI